MTTPPPIPPVAVMSGHSLYRDDTGRIWLGFLGQQRRQHNGVTEAAVEVTVPLSDDVASRLADGLLRFLEPAPSAHSAELANGSTCGFCGKPADVWPSKDCEEPQEHTTAVYDCDCGDVVTIADAIASPKQHRRCHLIGTGE